MGGIEMEDGVCSFGAGGAERCAEGQAEEAAEEDEPLPAMGEGALVESSV